MHIIDMRHNTDLKLFSNKNISAMKYHYFLNILIYMKIYESI